jgi:hypothetical protein
VRAASYPLVGALALTTLAGPATAAASDGIACRVVNVTQGTHGSSFPRMVARAHDGDGLRVLGSCTSNGVVIDKDLRIRGVGAGATLRARFETFDQARRVLRIAPRAKVVLRSLVIQGGWGEDCDEGGGCHITRGGGILNEGRLELRRVVLQLNGGLLVSGLAIWNGGTLVLRRSVVRYNQEQDGSDAAIVNHGTLLLRLSRVVKNDQAGIINHGDARVVDSVVARHREGDDAVGIVNHGRLTVIRSVIRNNRPCCDGGGIGNRGTLRVRDSVIRDNQGEVGGGIKNDLGATATISGSRIIGNTGDYGGGGIWNLGDLVLIDTVVRDNRSWEEGGGIYNGGLHGDPVGTLAIDGRSRVSGNSPDDCVGTSAC